MGALSSMWCWTSRRGVMSEASPLAVDYRNHLINEGRATTTVSVASSTIAGARTNGSNDWDSSRGPSKLRGSKAEAYRDTRGVGQGVNVSCRAREVNSWKSTAAGTSSSIRCAIEWRTFNCTFAAENLLIIHDPVLAAPYLQNWNEHAVHSTAIGTAQAKALL